MTTTEIAAEHGVSRQTIHTYRRTGVFPQPVEGEGSTRPRFRADEVDAFFEANPKQPGVKRVPSPLADQGVPVTATVDPRIAILSDLNDPPYNETAEKRCVPWDEAVKLLDAYRASVLREAADKLDESETLRELTDDHMGDVNMVTAELRRMANEAEASDG
ncbi:helix-turn-helix transcriptional regulator [Streptomyces mirabilis]|uniref:helix-turn-helix transcriptional regulator n=1 Tax=Streptomyces mirabilis TaxID=68239 RepID=UPI0033C336D6